jgi:hypothetical protein
MSKVLRKRATAPAGDQFECDITCSETGCEAVEGVIFHRDRVADLEAGRAHHYCKDHPPPRPAR